MRQMLKYNATNLNKYGPNLYPQQIVLNQSNLTNTTNKQIKKDRPLLINPLTKTWYKWDELQKDYLNTTIPTNVNYE